jgi:hypothetical protein
MAGWLEPVGWVEARWLEPGGRVEAVWLHWLDSWLSRSSMIVPVG